LISKERPNPFESRLEQVIQVYHAEGFSVQKTYLEQKAYTLVLLIGDKPLGIEDNPRPSSG
jgi:hypothetical protein